MTCCGFSFNLRKVLFPIPAPVPDPEPWCNPVSVLLRQKVTVSAVPVTVLVPLHR